MADMSDLAEFLFFGPVAIAGLALVVAAVLSRGRSLSEGDQLGLAWLMNSAIAGIFFVWCWFEADEWEHGLRVVASMLMAVLLSGQTALAIRRWRSGSRGWVTLLLWGSLLLLHLPILTLAFMRRFLNLPLG